jgi:hypothetical protein
VFISALTLPGCGDGYDYDDANPFVGRWQEVARGNEYYPELTPTGRVIWFFEDGTTDFYSYTLGATYRTDAEFLYLKPDDAPYSHTYRYTFSGHNTLGLDYAEGPLDKSMSTPTFYIYKRLGKE